MEAPNSKHQIPNKSQIPISKISNGDSSFEHFGLWILGIVWSLDIVIWDFHCSAVVVVICFPMGNKGVWWMPWLKKAMKDAS